ncbi:MAG TPA: carbon-nitrogen hydrolase family protein, partial [Urbifossiella sp.]
DYLGQVIHWAPENEEAIFTFEVDPQAARQKRVVTCAGTYEIDRVNWRRPEMYGPLLQGEPFTGHSNR